MTKWLHFMAAGTAVWIAADRIESMEETVDDLTIRTAVRDQTYEAVTGQMWVDTPVLGDDM